MKLISRFKLISLLLVSVTLTDLSLASDGEKPTAASGIILKVDEAKVSADWLAAAKKNYPLDTCPVSEDKLEGGDMQPLDYVYRQAGKPDRLVRLCCGHCVPDLKKEPGKYLKLIDDAAAAKAKAGSAK